jgi:hypothetical protein
MCTTHEPFALKLLSSLVQGIATLFKVFMLQATFQYADQDLVLGSAMWKAQVVVSAWAEQARADQVPVPASAGRAQPVWEPAAAEVAGPAAGAEARVDSLWWLF